MKRLFQLLGIAAGVVGLCVAGFIIAIEASRSRSDRQVRKIVAQIAPGTPFADVSRRLGPATQTFTNAEEIRVFGTRQVTGIVTNSVLHAYGHPGPPYRWILIYTDRQCQRVLHVDLKDL